MKRLKLINELKTLGLEVRELLAKQKESNDKVIYYINKNHNATIRRWTIENNKRFEAVRIHKLVMKNKVQKLMEML